MMGVPIPVTRQIYIETPPYNDPVAIEKLFFLYNGSSYTGENIFVIETASVVNPNIEP